MWEQLQDSSSEGIFMYSSAVSGFVVHKGTQKQSVLKEESIDCKVKVYSGRIFCAVCGKRGHEERLCHWFGQLQ